MPRAGVWAEGADTWREPDLFVSMSERLANGDAELVVEVSSPSTAVYDRTADATTVYRDDDACESTVLPGLRVTPRQVLAAD